MIITEGINTLNVELVPREALITPGWVVETQYPVWYPHAQHMWSNQIFREEYVTTVMGIYDSGPLTNGCVLGEPPYIRPECIGRTETVWVIEGIRYRVFTLVGGSVYGSSVRIEQHFLGIDSQSAREYWKNQATIPGGLLGYIGLPTGTPLCFTFGGRRMPDELFEELEDAEVADVTHFYYSFSGQEVTFVRVIVYDFDGFFDIIGKYQWFTMGVGAIQ